MKMSENIDQLATALAAAQAEMEAAKANAENPHFRSSYADLESIWNAAKPVLPKHGLSVAQVGDGPNLATVLMHKSGQWIAGSAPVVSKDDRDPQKFGSGWTYARRYGLAAMIGVVVEDDDGNSAASKPPASQQKPAPRPAQPTSQTPAPSGSPEPKPAPAKPASVGMDALIEGEEVGKGHPYWRMSREQKQKALGEGLDVVKDAQSGLWIVKRKVAA